MNNEKAKQSREAGASVWESMLNQLAEAAGFFHGMLMSLKTFIKKFFWSLLLFGVIATIASAAYWWYLPKYYNAQMTVSYVHYEKKIYADMLEKLDQLLQAGETKTLAELIGMEQDQLKSILFIHSYNIRKESLKDDLSTEKIPFYIEIGTTDPGVLPVLQNVLIDYLNSTEYIQSRLAYMHQKAEEELAFLERRLAIADSLSKMYIIHNEGINNEKAITRMELLEESRVIYSRIQEVKGLKVFNLNIEVLDGFIPIENKAGNGLVVFLLYGFITGIVIRLLILLF